MQFDSVSQANNKGTLRETWVEKEVYVEIDGDKIRFF
jgi:hypothetical protein